MLDWQICICFVIMWLNGLAFGWMLGFFAPRRVLPPYKFNWADWEQLKKDYNLYPKEDLT